MASQRPIFSGVVLTQATVDAGLEAVEHKVAAFRQRGADYIRLECNLGSAREIGEPAQLVDNVRCSARLRRLAEVARVCQRQSMVPLILLQVPWREPGEDSSVYFRQVVEALASAARDAKVDSKRVLLETRPPLPFSAQEERGLAATARTSLATRRCRTP